MDSKLFRRFCHDLQKIQWKVILAPILLLVLHPLFILWLEYIDGRIILVLAALNVLHYIHSLCVGQRRLYALIESYKPFFLNSYNVEMGLEKVNTGKKDKEGHSIVLYYIYFRRRHRDPKIASQQQQEDDDDDVEDAAAALEEGGDRNTGIPDDDFPPIFIYPFLPGEIYIDLPHDASSMKIDAETWELLQSTHQRSMKKGCLSSYAEFIGTFLGWYFSVPLIIIFIPPLDAAILYLLCRFLPSST